MRPVFPSLSKRESARAPPLAVLIWERRIGVVKAALYSHLPSAWLYADSSILLSPTLLPPYVAEPRSYLWVLLKDYSAVGFRRAWAMMQVALADRIEAKLPLIAAPVFVVRGGEDPAVPQRWAEEVTRLLPQGYCG
jgi:pimeloyl-ACP methyl ester carboxylesterase